MKTKYRVTLHGRAVGAIGITHNMFLDITLEGEGHTEEQIRIAAYDQAEHISMFHVVSSSPA